MVPMRFTSRVIQSSLMRHADSSSQHRVRKTKRPESTNAVTWQMKAGAWWGDQHPVDSRSTSAHRDEL